MKQYLAFVGYVYYPDGGMDDFLGDFDTYDEAMKAINTKIENNTTYKSIEEEWGYWWAHVYDTELRAKVWEK
jgi:hypothetical protein